MHSVRAYKMIFAVLDRRARAYKMIFAVLDRRLIQR